MKPRDGVASHRADFDAKVLLISVAARMAGMHPQTLRQYDRLGLVQPERTPGGGRRYSIRDVAMLREIQRMSQEEGINLAGVRRIIELEQVHQRTAAAHRRVGAAARRRLPADRRIRGAPAAFPTP